MTIYNTGYDTTIGSSLVTNKIIAAILETFIRGLLYDTNLDVIQSNKIKPVFVTGSNNLESEIPLFGHPIVVRKDLGNEVATFLCTDVRQFIRQDRDKYSIRNGNDIVIRNQTEFNLAKSRAIMNLIWLSGKESQLKNNFTLAGIVFAVWLTDCISKRFALDPADNLKLLIISHYYYQSLFEEGDTLDKEAKERFATHTIKITKSTSKIVFDIFDKIERLSSIDDYCNVVKSILNNVRLKDLSPGFIVTIIGNSWFGVNHREILAIALEHPPTWIALVYTALIERTFKNTSIARIALQYSKNNAGSDFTKVFVDMVTSYTTSDRVATEELKFNVFE